MKYNEHFYPYNPEPDKYPVYLTGVGGSEYQEHVVRPEGYYWHQILHCAEGQGTLRLWGQHSEAAFNNDSSVIVDGEQRALEITIGPGDYIFLPKGCPSEYYGADKKWDVRWIAFEGYALERMLPKLEMSEAFVLHAAGKDIEKLDGIFDQMIRTLHTNRLFGSDICSGLMYEYLIEFHLLMDTENLQAKKGKMNILLPVITYIEDHLGEDFPITDLAEVAGISHQHLCRLFKEMFHDKPNEYVASRRVEFAKKLISETTLSLAEISDKAGFVNPSYFSTVFRRVEGISPNEFRKNLHR